MSSLSNINNNSSVINVGRTTPVSPGQQPADASIPVVLAQDQTPIPVVEQNKIQSEVALSLLGIPRAEVALGIFADVNTYDVNPSEWSFFPSEYTPGHGIKHLPEEAGALVQAPKDEVAILTSKRFFRYQPGRVSSATFGVKSTISPEGSVDEGEYNLNPAIRKYGIFDKYDGYYWETRGAGEGDQFGVVRRTQALLKYNPVPFNTTSEGQQQDYGFAGKAPSENVVDPNALPTATNALIENRFTIAEDAYSASGVSTVVKDIKCRRDLKYLIDGASYDITLDTNYNATFLGLAETNSKEYPTITEGITPQWQNVLDQIDSLEVELKNLPNVNANADIRLGVFFDKVTAIVGEATRVDKGDITQADQIAFAKLVTFSNPSIGATASQIAAKEILIDNRDFITAEINAWVEEEYSPTSHNEEKCTRDVLYALNSFIYDILYTGNSATYDAAKFFFYDGIAKTSDVHKQQTLKAYERLRDILFFVVQKNTVDWTKTDGNIETQDTSWATAASTEDAIALQSLVQIIIDVIREGLLALPEVKTGPDVSWVAADYTTAKTAMEESTVTILTALVPGGEYSSDDLKCLRDLDFALDAYILDLQWGGNAHTIVNATTYGTATLAGSLDEVVVHEALRDAVVDFLTALGEVVAASKITTLSTILISAVGGTAPTQGAIDGANYGQRSAISTVFSIYNKYLGYLVSASLTYDASNPPEGVSEAEYELILKHKCIRDVVYVVDGYVRDLEFGGNAGTVFNAKNYYYNGIRVFSQTTAGVVAEIARHEFLKRLIGSGGTVTVTKTDASTVEVPSVLTRFGLTSLKREFDSLADIIIANFTTEYAGPAEFGSAGQYGNLIIYRDNLLMIHAAVFDPSLLKAKKQVVVRINLSNNTLEAAEGSFIVDQYINFVGNAGGLLTNKSYRVIQVSGPKSNTIRLADPLSEDPNAEVDITDAGVGPQYIEPSIPFVFPKEYFNGEVDGVVPNPLTNPFTKIDGMFPFLYTEDGVLPAGAESNTVGFIDTAIDTTTDAGDLKQQIDAVNLRWNNWIKENVDPKYYSVYEYRLPRSRFSTDQLNGQQNDVVYSDLATGTSGIAYPGQPVLENTGVQLENTSAWDMDFGKVIMLKIEFSWYGAVGALFLAYVPVGNGEARWVRVHHLRASNQLKIPSLGNATLPITYLVYGGGAVNKLGIEDTSNKGYGATSDHIVKYGASYYIDGGDRGTVRLYSYSNDNAIDVYGSKYEIGSLTTWDGEGVAPIVPHIASDSIGTYIDVVNSAGTTLPNSKVFFMNAKVVTSSRQDQNVQIIWIDGTKLYLNRSTLISNNGIFLVADRSSIVFGLKAKESISNISGVGVRNRVQVYPTKLAAANLSETPVKMRILKTPFFQPNTETDGSFTLADSFEVTAENLPLVTSSSYLSTDGDFVYGWFRANVGTVFGRLSKENDNYYFTLLETFSVPVILSPGIVFLKEERFDVEGNELTVTSESTITKERLSSVFVSTEIQCPVPRTGTEIASFFLKSGSDQFDLLSYFDYNKDYLSYPLTDEIESLYLSCIGANSVGLLGGINASLTWEEQ
jgi:hypothetical protein